MSPNLLLNLASRRLGVVLGFHVLLVRSKDACSSGGYHVLAAVSANVFYPFPEQLLNKLRRLLLEGSCQAYAGYDRRLTPFIRSQLGKSS
jgi:hypothetical protein